MQHQSNRPPLLAKGDKIGVVAPSRMIYKEQMERAFEVFGEWGLEVVSGEYLFAREGYFAGTDEQRRSDLQHMINDNTIKAIFCARGGYGMTRILDRLDLSPLRENPKWLIGFSDITALHLALQRNGVESIHGLMPVQFSYDGAGESILSLRNILFRGHFDYVISSSSYNRHGSAVAEITGGNLSLVVDSLGTSSEIQTEGKILFVEEIDEYLYKIDRMFMQLTRAGKLRDIAGLIIGDFSDTKDTEIAFGKSIYDLITDHITAPGIPVAFDFPAGHEAYHLAIPFGRMVNFSVNETAVKLSSA